VVTGAVYSGRAEVGDPVILSPHGIEARIRSIHAQNRAASCALAGQRCALNLSGLELRKVQIGRGDWALAANIYSPTQRLDVELKLLASEARHLSDGAPVQLHLAAASIPARVVLLGTKTLAAGRTALAQLVLDQPIAALHGDRFVLRDQAAQRTIGGGRVLDPFGTARGRAKPARLAELDALAEPSAQASLRRLLVATSDGVDLPQFERAWNLNDVEQQVLRAAVELQLVTHNEREFAISFAQWQGQRELLTQCMMIHHERHPERIGATETEILSATLDSGGAMPKSVASDPNNHSSRSIVNTIRRAALRSLIAERTIARDGLHLRLPKHRAQLSAKDQILFDRVSAVLSGAGLRPPIIGDLAKALNVELSVLQAFAQRASHSGHLAAVAANRFYLPDTVAALIQVARELAAQTPQQGFDAAAFRDKSGIGRNLTIQVLEFLDRNGLTRFARERRWMMESGASQESLERRVE
jgi:selenocysteine-specific elongation factor